MDASIIITNYNQSHILKYAIGALCRQKTDFSFEIIISDDGSSPEHIENIRKIIEHKKI